MKREFWAVAASMLVAALAGCRAGAAGGETGRRPSEISAPEAAAPAAAEIAPRLPHEGGAMKPALVEVEAGEGLGAELARGAEICESCHAEIAAQWRGSVHAAASFDNPLYRVSIERFRDDNGEAASRMCAACHDVALLVDGAMEAEVRPDDPRAHAGVSCLICHGIVEARPDGNGSYRLRSDEVVIPVEGDPASLSAHRARMAPKTLRTAALCGSCHKSFLGMGTGHDHHLPGFDDMATWRRSIHAGSRLDRVDGGVPERACADCHMPEVEAPRGDVSADNGRVRSHRFAGGHTWLAAMQGETEQLEATTAMLKSAATLRLSGLRRRSGELRLPADGAGLEPGEEIVLEVVIRNVGAGHRFPGGTLDAQDTWVELSITDARGERLAAAGQAWRQGRADVSLHRLHATLLDERGRPVLGRAIQDFRTPGYNHTITPRDRQLVRYAWRAPEQISDDAWPLRVQARLVHRSREPGLAQAACDEVRSPRGAAWDAARRARGRPPIDPCAPLPRTIVAEDDIELLPPSEATAAEPDAVLALDHGAAWAHALVEEIDRARPSFLLALDWLEGEQGPRAARLRAAALVGLGGVASRQGRTREMEHWLDRADDTLPGQPASAWVRGRGLMAVWRHDEAIPWLRVAAAGAPLDDRAWTALAVAAGSEADYRGSLAAARRALALSPRAPDPLRAQALALRGLGRDEATTRRALEAFLKHRRRDDGPALRSSCSMEVPGCALERTPNHLHRVLAADTHR